MRTTSGLTAMQTSSALRPSATAAATRRSGTVLSRSSSDSRKMSLSSTSTTVIGSAATSGDCIGLFGAEQKRIVGLTALVHLDLEVRVLLPDERDEVVEALGAFADQDREHVGAGLEQALRGGRGRPAAERCPT